MDPIRSEHRARIDACTARLNAALARIEGGDASYDAEVEYLNAHDDHAALIDGQRELARPSASALCALALALAAASGCDDDVAITVEGGDVGAEVELVEPDRRCVGFAGDWCGVVRRLELALVSADGEPLDADFGACVDLVVEGWEVDAGGAVRVVGGCDQPLQVDVPACMRALGELGAGPSPEGVDSMLVTCSRPR